MKCSSFSVVSLLTSIVSCSPGLQQVPLKGKECVHPPYTIHLFSKAPLVIYISNFLTTDERSHLQDVTKGTFARSAVADESGEEGHRQTRTSQSTTVPRDSIVRCIESRALAFQGFEIPRSHLEPLQLVQYSSGEKYHLHTDWFESPERMTSEVGGNRLSSFFVYIAAGNLTGGGTNFPILNAPYDERWCEFVDCDEPWDNGVTFKPVPGNAVFWQNLNEDGSGDPATIHAGLPVTSGSKLGMNIWTRQGPLSEKFRGRDEET
ncbi:2OG-Fe(II) oxygenase superfamily protein [Mollisia scopiformis]|uniref:2OG-Fe(II) oxygenase superfamily protein n=1 Tax=Mollisia scopiformis TaxID=149040 RepID=A0A194X7P7_MOLSC|nr:2OG-Fe(II) oxygenase superfamily protein [Mollisia scopiformis]KUJ15827.1 2OG-Fe(II) oxygenase superfamily protein [Mollisia scopiformis]